MSASSQDYRRYEELRLSLKDVQRGFERAALSWPNLIHKLVSAPDKSLSIEAWNAFRDSNRKSDGGWDWWEPFPDGSYCSQFLGEEKWLEVFYRLAESGMLVLKEIAGLQEVKGATPDGMRATLPDVGYRSGWLSLVYGTAELATSLLRAKFWAWNVPEGTFIDEVDSLMYDSWTESPGGVSIPLHPPYYQLHLDLFNSSVEAIRCWLFPEAVTSLWNLGGDSPINLPSTNDDGSENLKAILTSVPSPTNNTEDRPQPRYDKKRRVLYVGDDKAKELKKPARNVVLLLSAFEEMGWPPVIDDPIPPTIGIVRQQRLKNTIDSLNTGLRLIRFGGNGTGKAVKWWHLDDGRSSEQG